MVDRNPERQAKKHFDESHIKKGALHKQLGIPEGKKIPTSTLERLKSSRSPQTRKRANFALNARSWKH